MNKKNFLVILVIVILLSIGITSITYSFYIIKETKELDVILKVDDKVGLNVDSDAVKFGKVPPGGSGQRTISLKNNHNTPLKVDIRFSGEVRYFVHVSDNYFWLEPQETKEITAVAHVPKDTEFGIYTGKMRVLFKTT